MAKVNPKPPTVHYNPKGWGYCAQCQVERMKGRWSHSRSKAQVTSDVTNVTCKQCLNLIKTKPELFLAVCRSVNFYAIGEWHAILGLSSVPENACAVEGSPAFAEYLEGYRSVKETE